MIKLRDSVKIKLTEKESCFSSFISWDRLQTVLKVVGELEEDEHITHVKVNDVGITYYRGRA